MEIKKAIVIVASILLTVGIVSATFSIQESYTEESTLNRWDLNNEPITLKSTGPGLIWGLEMPERSFFELNVSASGSVRVRIGTPTFIEDTEEVVLTNLIFDHVGTRFTQKVEVDKSGTYQVEIKNEGTPVNISGNVFAKKIVTIYQAVYPYSSLGTLVAIGGLTLLIYGVLIRPKKRRSKRKARKIISLSISAISYLP